MMQKFYKYISASILPISLVLIGMIVFTRLTVINTSNSSIINIFIKSPNTPGSKLNEEIGQPLSGKIGDYELVESVEIYVNPGVIHFVVTPTPEANPQVLAGHIRSEITKLDQSYINSVIFENVASEDNVVNILTYANDKDTLQEYTLKLASELEQKEYISKVNISNVSQDYLSIKFDIGRLNQFNLSLPAVQKVISEELKKSNTTVTDITRLREFLLTNEVRLADVAAIESNLENVKLARLGLRGKDGFDFYNAGNLELTLDSDFTFQQIKSELENNLAKYNLTDIGFGVMLSSQPNNATHSLLGVIALALMCVALVIGLFSGINRAIFTFFHVVLSLSLAFIAYYLINLHFSFSVVFGLSLSLIFIVDMALQISKFVDRELDKDQQLSFFDKLKGFVELIFPEGLLIVLLISFIGMTPLSSELATDSYIISILINFFASFIVGLIFSFDFAARYKFFNLTNQDETQIKPLQKRFVDLLRDKFLTLGLVVCFFLVNVFGVLLVRNVAQLELFNLAQLSHKLEMRVNLAENFSASKKDQIIKNFETKIFETFGDALLNYSAEDFEQYMITKLTLNSFGDVEQIAELNSADIEGISSIETHQLNYLEMTKPVNEVRLKLFTSGSYDVYGFYDRLRELTKDYPIIKNVIPPSESNTYSYIKVSPVLENLETQNVKPEILEAYINSILGKQILGKIGNLSVVSSSDTNIKSALTDIQNSKLADFELKELANIQIVQEPMTYSFEGDVQFVEYKLLLADNTNYFDFKEFEKAFNERFTQEELLNIGFTGYSFESTNLEIYQHIVNFMQNNGLIMLLALAVILSIYFSKLYPILLSFINLPLILSSIIIGYNLTRVKPDIFALLALPVILACILGIVVRLIRKLELYSEHADGLTVSSVFYQITESILLGLVILAIVLPISLLINELRSIYLPLSFGLIALVLGTLTSAAVYLLKR